MSTPRQTIAAQFKADHGASWLVQEYPAGPPADLRKPLAVVYRTDIEPGESSTLKHQLTVQLYGLGASSSKAEDELDDLLDGALLSLQRIDGVTLEKATRSVFADSFAGWELTLYVVSEDVYRKQVIQERKQA